MLYLAIIEITCTEYMGDTTEETKTQLVEAESKKEAVELLKTLYEKESEYHSGPTYNIFVDSIVPVLSKANLDTFFLEK